VKLGLNGDTAGLVSELRLVQIHENEYFRLWRNIRVTVFFASMFLLCGNVVNQM